MGIKTTYKEYLYYLRRAYPHWTEEARKRRAWKLHERQTLIPKKYEVLRPVRNWQKPRKTDGTSTGCSVWMRFHRNGGRK